MGKSLANQLRKTFFRRSMIIAGVLSAVLLVLTPVLMYLYTAQQYQVESAELLESFIGKEMKVSPRAMRENPEILKKVAARINIFMEFGNVVEFKIWDVDGTVVYAFQGRDHIGKRFGNPRLMETLKTGEIEVEIEDTRDAENLDLQKYGRLVEMYAPIRTEAGIVGAVEVYRIAPQFRFLKSNMVFVVTDAFLLFGLLYVLLYGQFRKAASALVKHEEMLEDAYDSLGTSYFDTIRSLIKALEMRDMETEGHSERVVSLATRMGGELRLSEEEMDRLVLGAYLHDIGKIGIPDRILLNPQILKGEDRRIMEKHVLKGGEIIRGIDFLQPASAVVFCHHERWDGDGYPCGLRGTEIPMAARIFSIVDVFDALTSDRPYRAAMPLSEAAGIIREEAGKAFDPELVPLFLDLVEREMPLHEKKNIAMIVNERLAHILVSFVAGHGAAHAARTTNSEHDVPQ